MGDDGSRLTQRPLGHNLFEARYRGRVFLVRAYPLRIVELEGELSPELVTLELAQRLLISDAEGTCPPPPFGGFGAVELVATTRCNLRCIHCTARTFDREGDDSYYGMPARDMPLATMLRAVDHGIDQLEARLARHPVARPVFEIFVTGGEPLMVWQNLRKTLQHARTRVADGIGTNGFTFTPHIVTNGWLIDDKVAHDLVESDTTITVALDSPFNQVRVDAQGRPATPRAIQGLKRLVAAHHPRTSVNLVIAGEDMDRIDRIFGWLEEQEVFEGITTIQLSPLAPPIQHTAFAGKGLRTRRSGFADEVVCRVFSEKLIEYSGRYDLDMKQYGNKLGEWLVQGGTPVRCPVAEWKWCVAPDGDVFACHQLVGIPSFRMGNLSDNGWFDSPSARRIREQFLGRTVFQADRCAECVLCSSCMVFVDCPARSFLEVGRIEAVVPHYCDCGRTYLEKLLGEHLISLIDEGRPAVRPLCRTKRGSPC